MFFYFVLLFCFLGSLRRPLLARRHFGRGEEGGDGGVISVHSTPNCSLSTPPEPPPPQSLLNLDAFRRSGNYDAHAYAARALLRVGQTDAARELVASMPLRLSGRLPPEILGILLFCERQGKKTVVSLTLRSIKS